MKKTMDNARLSLSIGIALTTGMFTMLPVVAASPVQDTSATNTSGVNVKNSGAQTIGGQDYKTTDITSTATNNVISWKDFSVAKGEAVRFDGGATSGSNAHNYLNVVTGDATSQINGKIIGGNNVYIVNPNGVIFGESASVNVGNLYVSTQKATEVVAGNMSSTNPASVIGSTAGQADVVNLGKVQANSVTVVGKNVRFSNTSNITSDGSTPLKGVAVTAGGYAHIGYDTTAASKLGYTVNGNTSTSNDFQLINTEDALKQVSSSGNYMLGTDLKLTTSYTNSVIPTFSGQFDGMFHEISGLDVTSSNYVPTGLFGTLSGANIFNLGIVGANVKASQTKLTSIFSSGGVGILSGRAVNGTTIKNVYAENGTFNSGSYNGSLTGYADASTYNTVYASNVSGSKALIGLVYNTSSDGTVTIDTAYNSNTGYVVDTYRGGSNLTVKNIYATAASGVRSGVATTASNVISNAKQTSDYSGLSSSDWLKQDGQFPILQAFLKGTVTVNYNYNHENTTYTAFNKTTSDSTSQADKGSNNGADLKLTYNAAPVQIVDADGKVVSDWTSAVTLSNGLTGAEAISQGLLSKNTYQYNSSVSDPLDANVVGGTSATSATSRALFVTTQHGYKLVGNNVTILPREATITADNLAHVSQEYNGSAELTAATKAALLAGSNGSGIIPGDTTASITTDNLHGYFVGSTADNDDGSAAALNKTIHLWGGANLENATGYSNYILSADSVSFGDTDATGTNITALGDITQKAIGYKTNGTVDKIYDGTATAAVNTKVFVINEADKASTSSTGTDGKTTKTADDVSLDTSGTGTDGKYLDSTDLTTEEHNANEGGTAYAVKYTGIKLTGKDAGNYKLIDASGNTLYRAGLKDYSTGTTTDAGVTGGTIYATGYINRRFIDTSTFTVQGDTSHTKIYDGTSTYNVPTGATFTTNDSNTSQGLVDADKNYITFKMADNATSYFTDDSGNAAVDVDTATKIAYQIGATTSDTTDHPLSNYKIGTTSDSAKALTSSDSYNVFGEGSITPRTLILDLTGKNNINKVYDGDTAVEEGTDTDYTKVGGGYIVYDSSSKKLLADDSTAGTTDGVAWKISAKYDDKNVKRDASGNVIKNQNNVTYTVGLSGDATKLHNYVLQKDTSSTSVAGDETITLGAAGDAVRNTGTITPRTVQLTFDDAYRTYDGTTAFGNSKNRSGGDVTATISNLVNGDTVTVGYDTAQSVYNSANVKDATTVTYGGVTLSGDSAGNYQLGSTAYTGNGTIEKLKITGVNLALADGYTSITKEYDNSDAVEGDVKSYVGNLTATDENGNSLTFTQGSGSTTSDTTYTISTSTAPVYESKNSNNSAKQSVYYSLNVGTSNDNYEFDSSLLSNGLLRTTVNNGSDKTVGVITPRLVQVSASDTPFTKTYDTTLKAFDVKGDSLDASKGIALAHRAGNGTDSATAIYDSDLGNLSVNAAYTDKNANLDKDGQALSGHSLNDKTIQYTFTLSGDSAGNYTLVDTSGKNLNGTLNATGNIKQAPLALTISKATKTYDKDNYVTPAATLTYTPQRGDSVTIGYQTAADSNGKSESATYDDANVGTDKLVTYQLAKSGTDANNYYVTYINYTDKNTSATAATNADKFTVVNLGDIGKKSITSKDITATFGNITKVYDASNSVAYDHSGWKYQAGQAAASDYLTGANQGLTVDGVKRTLTTASTGGDYTIAGAVYDSPTVQATKATYTLTLGDWANNYDWKNITNYSNGTLTLTSAATITPKYVVASVKDKTAAGYVSLDKVYNGSTNLVRNSRGNVVLDGIIANDAASLDTTNLNSNSAYQSPNVAYDADKNPTAQNVSYAVKLTGNSAGNYVLLDAANTDTAALTNGTATGAASVTLTDTGIISPYVLKTPTFAYAQKIFDASADIEHTADTTIDSQGNRETTALASGTLTGVNGETITLSDAAITGNYGTWTTGTGTDKAYTDAAGTTSATGTFTVNEHVNYDPTTQAVGYKAVQYTNLQAALAAGTVTGGNALAGNYALASDSDTATYTEAAQLGKITRRDLSLDDIKVKPLETTKVYDGTDAVKYQGSAAMADVAKYLDIYTEKTHSKVPIAFDLSAATYDNGQTDVTTGHGVTFTLAGLSSTVLGDFTLSAADAASFNGKKYTTTGDITARPVYVSLRPTTDASYVNIERTYDGTSDTSVKQSDAMNNVIINTGTDEGLLDSDGVKLNTASTQVTYDNGNAGTGKTLTYKLQLNGSKSGNYAIYDLSSKGTTGASTISSLMSSDGIIDKAKLSIDFARQVKAYDGKSGVLTISPTLSGLVGGDSLQLAAGAISLISGNYVNGGSSNSTTPTSDVNRDSQHNVIDRAVSYTGIDQALNYMQTDGSVDAATQTIANNYTIDATKYYSESEAKGRITPLTLSADKVSASWNDISRVYNGTPKVDNPENYLNGLTATVAVDGTDQNVNLNNYTINSAEFTSSSDYSTPQSDVGSDLGLKYGLTFNYDQVGNTAAGNYVVDNNYELSTSEAAKLTTLTNANADGSGHANQASITVRPIYVSLGDNVTIERVYNGAKNTGVAQANAMNNVILSSGANDGLIGTDDVTMNTASTQVTYDNGNAGTGKTLTYQLQLLGDKASNYAIYSLADKGNAAADTIGSLTGTNGIIDKATLSIDFARQVKDYNGSSNIDTITPTLSGLQAGDENFALSDAAKKLITGSYVVGGDSQDTTETANVNRDANNAVTDRAVYYTGIGKALAYMQENGDDATKAIASNYTIADTKYFGEAMQKGRILPLVITADKVHADWAGPVSREYNTTSKVYDPSAYLKGLHADFGNGPSTALTYSIADAVYTDSDNYDQEHSGVGKDLGLRYTVELSPDYKTITSGDGQGNVIVDNNYEMTAATAKALTTVTNADSYSSDTSVVTHANAAGITPRIINASLKDATDLVKIYDGNKWADGQTHADGTTATVDYRDRLVISTEKDATGWSDADVLAADAAKGTVNSATTVAYDDRNADIGSADALQNGKGLTYTLTLSGSGTGNYTLDTTGTATTATQDYTGATGDIRRRQVTVGLKQTTGLDKTYDGNANAYGKLTQSDGTQTTVDYRDNVYMEQSAGGHTGVVAGDDLSILADSISAAYASPNVVRTSSGAVTTQQVTYSNINFGGADASNYEVTGLGDDKTLTGTGTIYPRMITVAALNAPTKVYDGTTAVTGNYATAANLNIDRSNVITGDTVNVTLTGTPVYESSDANEYENGTSIGSKGKIGVDYQIVWDNQNYELVRASSSDTIDTDAAAQSDGTLTKKFVSNTGVITPRTLTLTTSQTEKTYDGTTNVISPEGYVTIGNLASGQSVADLSRTVNGVFSSANAADSEDASETARIVTYTVSIDNTNYQLDSTGAQSTTTTGTGLIHRRGLTVVATPASILTGQASPDFTGYVTGWINGEDTSANQGNFTYATPSTTDTQIWGRYPIYGYYNGQTSGNYGNNYTFAQADANSTAFYVRMFEAGREYHETVNPKGQVRPDNTIYKQSSHDFGNNGNRAAEAAIAYTTSGGSTTVMANLDGGAGYSGNMSIVGSEVVNLAGGDALDASAAIVSELPGSTGSGGLTIEGHALAAEPAATATSGGTAAIESAGTTTNLTGNSAEDTSQREERKLSSETTSSTAGTTGSASLETEGSGVNVSA